MNFETSKTLLNINKKEDINSLNTENENIERNSTKKNRTSKLIGNIKLVDNFNPNDNKEISKSKKSSNSSGEYSNTDNVNNPIPNLKTFYDKNIYNSGFFNFGKYDSSKRKMTLIKNSQINNLNLSLKGSTRDQIFKTEIKEKIANKKEENKKSDFSTTFSDYFNKQKNSLSLRNINKKEKSENKDDNPLLIPKEDMIFEEIKNYKCFKYFTKDSLSKTSVPFIYINMDMNTTKKSPPKKNEVNNNNPYQINFNNNLKKFIQFDEVFLKKKKNIFFDEEKKKNLLDNVYRVPTAEDMYDKINLIKLKKDKKKLKSYQHNFLKVVKHNITDKYYEDLRERFNEIRHIAEGKYKTNYKFIKEIEKDEEKVIKDINRTFENFMEYSKRRSIRNILTKPGRSRIDLPQIKFEKIINEDYTYIKNKFNKNKKSSFISLSENKRMNRTSFKIKKRSNVFISNFNSNKNLMMTTSKRFSKIKFFKDKI